MILGMSVSAFTVLHVVLSLIGMVSGLVVLAGMLGSKTVHGWTVLFLVTTVLTSATGFLFPRDQILPSPIVGVISLVVLLIAIVAFYGFHLARAWRWFYVACALWALYLNAFVLVAQGFQQVAFLKALAPAPSDPPFVIAQLVVLVALVALGSTALRSFHPAAGPPALRTARPRRKVLTPQDRRPRPGSRRAIGC